MSDWLWIVYGLNVGRDDENDKAIESYSGILCVKSIKYW